MKLADPPAFAVIIGDFGLVPDWSVMSIAMASLPGRARATPPPESVK